MNRRPLLRFISPLVGAFFVNTGAGAQEPDPGLVVEDASTVRYSVMVLAPLEWLDEKKAEALVEERLREAHLRPQRFGPNEPINGPYLSVWVHQTLSGLLFDVAFRREVYYSLEGSSHPDWADTWTATGARTTVGSGDSLGLSFLDGLVSQFIQRFGEANP